MRESKCRLCGGTGTKRSGWGAWINCDLCHGTGKVVQPQEHKR